jgi:CubicO group peptidase (beta-lactamase class C family)
MVTQQLYSSVMRSKRLAFVLLLPCLTAAHSAPATNSRPDLDGIVQQAMAQEHVVGASVLAAKGGEILLRQ